MTSSLCVVTFVFLVKSVMTSQVINIANDDVMLAIHTRAVQASQASSICRENASRLVSIEDAKIQQLITAHIGEIPIDETHFNDRRLFVGFWTAGRQEAQDDGWMWWTGDQQPGLDPDHRRPTAILEDEDERWSNYTNWVGYSPVITMYPSCIYVYPHYQVVYETSSVNVTFNDTIGGWLNKPCRMRSYFICEKKINKQTVTSSNTAYYVIIPVIFVILSIVIVTGFCFLYRRRTRMLKMKSARSSNHMTEELRNGYRDDDDDDVVNNGGGDDVTNGLTRDTQFNDSWKNDDAVMTSSRRGRQISQLNNETYESNIHFTPVKKNDDSDYDEPPDEREYFERNKLFSNFDENDYDVPPDEEVFGTHSEFSSDESYHLSDIEAFDTHSQDQGISSPTHPPPPEPEQIYASIESLNKIERSSSAPRRGIHHQQSLHKITNFSHIPHRDVSHRKKFPLPHEAQHSNHRSFANHRNTTQSMRSHDTIPENRV